MFEPGCKLRRVRNTLFNYIPLAGSDKTRVLRRWGMHHRIMRSPPFPALPRSLFGSSNISVADGNNETPATASPPYKLPVFWLIHPAAYGPANPPRFASELTKAIPEAAANPVRKSPGSE